MSVLFAPVKVMETALEDRFVRSATFDSPIDPSANVSERQLNLFKELADGEIGIIITGTISVDSTSRTSPFQKSLAHDSYISSFQKLTDAVHERKVKIAA